MIIYPHWPPSNLAGVHRPRLVANYLKEFGWHPIILTVDPEYYEEKPDNDLCKTVDEHVEVHYTQAFSVTKPRLIGDIGLRSFWQIYVTARRIIKRQNIDFIWIPIPSFYMALMGRLLYRMTKIPYGIDYIDPWVRDISSRKNFRHILSNRLAKILEPIAVKKASLITGVAESYFQPVINRNFKYRAIQKVAFPYGFDPNDYKIEPDELTYPWEVIPNCKPIVYAGAFLPNSRVFIDNLFLVIRQMVDSDKWDKKCHLYFLGTGNYPGKTIMEYAREHNIEQYVHEVQNRYPYLHILNFLSSSFGVMVIGSTEKHYTASKVYQGTMSNRPLFAILHKESSAYKVLQEVNADKYTLTWYQGIKVDAFQRELRSRLYEFLNQENRWNPDLTTLKSRYSSKMSAKTLSAGINTAIMQNAKNELRDYAV